MAALAAVSELRVVHLRVTGNAFRSSAGRGRVSLIVTSLALRLGVTSCEAQTGMIPPDVGDLTPVGFVVTGRAIGSLEPPFVRILVAGHTVGPQTEKRGVSAPVATIVTVFTSNRCVSALERPPRQSMVEAGWATARPPDELGVSSQMLDVTLATRLVTILTPVQARLLPNASTQVFVTC